MYARSTRPIAVRRIRKKKKSYVRNSNTHSPALPEVHDVAGQGAGFVAEYMLHPSEVLVQFARPHLLFLKSKIHRFSVSRYVAYRMVHAKGGGCTR